MTTTVVDGVQTLTSAPEWSDTDRAWAVALQALEADTCGGCGQALSETLSAEAEFESAGLPHRCKGCDALTQAADKHRDSPRPNALRFPIERVDGG